MTWRTIDFIPKSVLARWHFDRDAWLLDHGIESERTTWKSQLLNLEPEVQQEFFQKFSERWHRHLDSCHGTCPLRDPILAQVVAESLNKFDNQRYLLTDFIVMPNHVHLLVAFNDEEGMLEQLKSWKHYTARVLNQRLNRSGRFWQQDGFDHLVRNTDQFEALRRYIANNPGNARLKKGEFVYFSKDLSDVSK